MIVNSARELIDLYNSGERNFSGSDLNGSNLSSISLKDTILKECNLLNANLSNSDLTNVDFSGSFMARVNLDRCLLKNTNFFDCDMTGSSIRDVNLESASFARAKLMFAHLCGNDMLKCDLTDAVLEWSCLIGAALSQEQLNKIPKTAITGGIDNVSNYSSQRNKGGYGAFSEPSGYGISTASVSTYGGSDEIANRRSIESYSKGEGEAESGYNKKEEKKDLLKKDLLDRLLK
ncbi:MAG: pentapeptide repeat-containing protein [Candidatus Aenigmarchaeota archaeon]|nr:pentapeptide repeat-containing protein [Candidatus Aenigmarchaeota archaeon]